MNAIPADDTLYLVNTKFGTGGAVAPSNFVVMFENNTTIDEFVSLSFYNALGELFSSHGNP